ncbi:hypothetical protein Emed_000790 [Eimeria media]
MAAGGAVSVDLATLGPGLPQEAQEPDGLTYYLQHLVAVDLSPLEVTTELSEHTQKTAQFFVSRLFSLPRETSSDGISVLLPRPPKVDTMRFPRTLKARLNWRQPRLGSTTRDLGEPIPLPRPRDKNLSISLLQPQSLRRIRSNSDCSSLRRLLMQHMLRTELLQQQQQQQQQKQKGQQQQQELRCRQQGCGCISCFLFPSSIACATE